MLIKIGLTAYFKKWGCSKRNYILDSMSQIQHSVSSKWVLPKQKENPNLRQYNGFHSRIKEKSTSSSKLNKWAFGDAIAFIVYDQIRAKFISLRKSTNIHIATVIEVELQNAKTFEGTHFNMLSALNNIEAKKSFEFIDIISGYKLLYRVEPLGGEVLDYEQQSRGSYNEKQIFLYTRMEEYKRQVFEEGWLSLIGPYSSPIGDSAHPSFKKANEGINVVMESAANTQRNNITENGSGLLSQWLSSGITAAAQDTEIVLDFFLFDPGGTYAEFEGGCATIVNSDPIIIDPTPLVAKLKVEVTSQSNFLKSQSNTTNFKENACGFLLAHVVCISPICDEILEISVACCKQCGAKTSSTKMGSKEWSFHLSGFKQWDLGGSPFKQLAGTYLSLHLENKVNFEGAGIDADIRFKGNRAYERGKWRPNKWGTIAPKHT